METKISPQLEIDKTWLLDINKIKNNSKQPHLFSPDGLFFCTVSPSFIEFTSESNTTSLQFTTLKQDEILTAIATVQLNPWILVAGTNQGNLYFFNKSQIINELNIHNDPIINIHANKYRQSPITIPYDVLLSVTSTQILIVINLKELLPKISTTQISDVKIDYWTVNHKQFSDAIIINSDINTSLLSHIQKFPVVYTIGNSPFVKSSSIEPSLSTKWSHKLKSGTDSLLKWFIGTNKEKEFPHPVNSKPEWELTDQDWKALLILPDSTGRWLAIVDDHHRILLIDGIFGNMQAVLKGYRKGQVAWIDDENGNPYLVIYAPQRFRLILAEPPACHIIDTVEAEKGGFLTQTIKPNGQFSANLTIPSGTVISLKIERKEIQIKKLSEKPRTKISLFSDNFQNDRFSIPTYLTSSEFSSLINVRKLLSASEFNSEEFLNVAKGASSPDEALEILNSMIITEQEDSIFMQVFSEYQKMFSIQSFYSSDDPNIAISADNVIDFFSTTSTSDIQNDTPFRLSQLISLYSLWKTVRKYDALAFHEPYDPIYDPKNMPLSTFLTCPLSNVFFFFAPLLKQEDLQFPDLIRGYMFCKDSRKEFLFKILRWYLTLDVKDLELSIHLLDQLVNSNLSIKILNQTKEIDQYLLDVFEGISQSTYSQEIGIFVYKTLKKIGKLN